MNVKHTAFELIGLIPAGGRARRISPLPCSKETFPIGLGQIRKTGEPHPKAAAHYLLEAMLLAGARKAYIILANGKWDIPGYFGSGSMVGMAIGYLMTEMQYGVPFTLDCAFPFVQDKTILFGFPDIIIRDEDVFLKLLACLDEGDADIVLGLFPAVNSGKMDMVDLKKDGSVRCIQIKPRRTNLKWTWIAAAWRVSFTQFMHDAVKRHLFTLDTVNGKEKNVPEIHVGDIIQAAIEKDMKIDKVLFPEGVYIDIGTPEDMVAALKMLIPND